MPQINPLEWFHLDALSLVMAFLVSFVALTVAVFGARYLRGDSRYTSFFARLAMLVVSILVLVTADQLMLLFVAWVVSNVLLVRLMVHKSVWKAARMSGRVAARRFVVGGVCVGLSFFLLFTIFGTSSIQQIQQASHGGPLVALALVLMLAGAMAQCGIWPFHRWLTSSLTYSGSSTARS